MSASSRWLAGLVGTALIALSAYALMHAGNYGWTIFIVLPVMLGGLSTWVLRPSSTSAAAMFGAMTVSICTFALLFVHIEGLICILMCLPIVACFGILGAVLVHVLLCAKAPARTTSVFVLLPLATFAYDVKAHPRIFAVHSSIEVAATPDQVWKHVVAFSPLTEPAEWYFRAGVAYPQRARIVGSGPGATRYCEFSTGTFVEPIEVWDRPHLLHFRVDHTPAPLHELSPYGTIEPKHLHGYLISKQGEFRLMLLANGHTLLEGTTWYQHGLWPAEYWRWWSDAIIHRIHMRVLNHVRTLAEADAAAEQLAAR
jgi:Polyketide cyclase / dehydrase and lipid transport